jgi:predicted transcriptional regulator of viral defense system
MKTAHTFPPKWEDFLRSLTDRLSKTKSSLPCIRCLTKGTLVYLFKEIQKDLALPSTYPSGINIIEHLMAMGLATKIPLDNTTKVIPSKDLFIIGIFGSHSSEIDPLEMMQAYNLKGVICFFSALAHLNLTTQIPAHNHIANLMPRKKTETVQLTAENGGAAPMEVSKTRSKMGTPIFSYQNVPIFSTKRIVNSIPGIKSRILSPWAIIRMTTIEQTLLDTLQYPLQCGGSEVVFEAWEKQISNLNDDLILEYLKIINIPPLTRRLGAILDLFNHRPTSELSAFLEESRSNLFIQPEVPEIPILKGMFFSRLNSSWNVLIP